MATLALPELSTPTVVETQIQTPRRITIRKPDDFHVHFREGSMLKVVAPFTARRFGRGLAMPNTSGKIRTRNDAGSYRCFIAAAAQSLSFKPLIACYLTADDDPGELVAGFREGIFLCGKAYPKDGTTGSDAGLTSPRRIPRTLSTMQKFSIPLCIHAETVWWKDREIPHDEREHVYLNEEMPWIKDQYPALRIVMEHVSTAEGVRFVKSQKVGQVAATITAHHPWMNKVDVLRGGMCTALHCLPVLKPEEDRLAVREAMTSGDNHFFLGTDSAPHPLMQSKRAHRAAGGIFTAHAGIELYAHMFDEDDALSNLENFASVNGALFYGLALNSQRIELERIPWTVNDLIKLPGESQEDFIWPFLHEVRSALRKPINWRIVD